MSIKLEKQIADMEAKLQEMREELNRKKKWEPCGGKWTITSSGDVLEGRSVKQYAEHGTERSTEEKAERARDRMRVFNRLLAYRDEHASTNPSEWLSNNERYFIIYDHSNKVWATRRSLMEETIGTIYMPENVARDLCNKLNSGEVVL